MKKSAFDPKPVARILYLLIGVVLLFTIVFVSFVAIVVLKPARFWESASSPAASAIVESPVGKETANLWRAPDESEIPTDAYGEKIRYGKELIAHTSLYLGPKGTVSQISNGLNCQNCHLQAGTKAFGNNYGGVASTYPKVRPRSGKVTSIEARINGCFERSLNGKALADNSEEMQAIVAYMKWVGKDVEKGLKPEGAGLMKLSYLDFAASPEIGQGLYEQKCLVCHGKTGEGVANAEGTEYVYPPLWGEHSYNQGAGLYRLSRFAGYIKANMPLGVTYDKPQLSDEESWHIAAYVNSLQRPGKDLSKDWPDISNKPIDHPFGPYSDGFNEQQHKYGPFKPIEEKRQAQSLTK